MSPRTGDTAAFDGLRHALAILAVTYPEALDDVGTTHSRRVPSPRPDRCAAQRSRQGGVHSPLDRHPLLHLRVQSCS